MKGIRSKIFYVKDKTEFLRTIRPDDKNLASVSELCSAAGEWFKLELEEFYGDINSTINVSTDDSVIRQDFEESAHAEVAFSVKTLNTFLCFFFRRKNQKTKTHYVEHSIENLQEFFSHILIRKPTEKYRLEYNFFIENISPLIPEYLKDYNFGLNSDWCWELSHVIPTSKPARVLGTAKEQISVYSEESNISYNNDVKIKILNSRTSFFAEAIKIIQQRPRKIRIMLTGPVCFHPEWVYKIRDDKESRRSFSREIKKYLNDNLGIELDIRIIFFNSDRYVKTVEKYINLENIDKFKTELIGEVDRIFKMDKLSSLKICSINTGFFQVVFLTEKYCLEASGESENTPIASGVLHEDSNYLEFQLNKFDRIFDHSYRGLSEEILELKSFVKEIKIS